MTRDVRNNLIIAALVASLIAHVVAMFWAKPHVMTHVTAGIARITHRGPMRVREAAAKPEPVKIDVMRDEVAEKDAPEASGAVAVLPSDETALPAEPAVAVVPEVATSEWISRLNPNSTVPKMEEALLNEMQSSVVPRMEFEDSPVPGTMTPYIALSMPSDSVATPVFEAPVFAPAGRMGDGVVSFDHPSGPANGTFTPVAEVMPEVDAKIVEQEKSAVRDLVDSVKSADLCAVTEASLAAYAEGGYTYFRATVRPKSSLKTVPKDVVVLIDASGSIGHDRLSSCRKAAREVLRTAMNTGDRFNIVAFRDKFSYAFRTWQTCDAAGYAAGDAWMSRLAAHGRTDVFATISSVLTLPRDPTRPLIALVVTDGEANVGVSETAEILAKFTALNDGLISVYMYGVKESANRELIDVLTRGNRGESVVFDGWRWNAGEGIGAFSERFRDPLVTDLRVVFPSTLLAEAYPALLKNLYRDNAVEIVGRVKGAPKEISFSMRGLSGETAYEGFYRLPLSSSRADPALPVIWHNEWAIDAKLR